MESWLSKGIAVFVVGGLAIAALLTVGSVFLQQPGLDSRVVQVVDARSNELKDFRIVSVVRRDSIRAISDPEFVSVAEASRWMSG